MEQAKARETVRAVAADLGGVADLLPVQPEQVEAKARILDRLSEELAEAAGMLRRSAPSGPPQLRNHPVGLGYWISRTATSAPGPSSMSRSAPLPGPPAPSWPTAGPAAHPCGDRSFHSEWNPFAEQATGRHLQLARPPLLDRGDDARSCRALPGPRHPPMATGTAARALTTGRAGDLSAA
jgi:hypothetical protein